MSYKIGVIGAMDVEVSLLRERLEGRTSAVHAGMEFSEGSFGGHSVVIARCGVGKVNAAMCVQVLASVYGVTHVINTGVAGSLDASIDIGDLVVSTDVVHHDVDATVFGYAPGQVPGMKTVAFEADVRLAAAVSKAASEVAPNISVHAGRVVSGDQFVASDTVKERIAKQFDGRCCEMEGAAVAQACHLNKLPFVVVRAISDKADGSAEVAYPEFETKAAQRCARIVQHMLSNMFEE